MSTESYSHAAQRCASAPVQYLESAARRLRTVRDPAILIQGEATIGVGFAQLAVLSQLGEIQIDLKNDLKAVRDALATVQTDVKTVYTGVSQANGALDELDVRTTSIQSGLNGFSAKVLTALADISKAVGEIKKAG